MQTTTQESAASSSFADRIRLEPEWKRILIGEFQMPYMAELREFLRDQINRRKTIYPKPAEIFAAFDHTPFSKVRVLILGQDPYHGPGQAHGLCFSVRKGTPPPPSLQNIFKELKSDLGLPIPSHGDLTKWADQGVLLLNTVLTVEQGRAASHHGRGWESFTDRVIQVLNDREEPVIFVLWGSPAQKKRALITNKKHVILTSPHPSPLSAHRGFFGSRHFSKINEILASWGRAPIDWAL